MNELTLKLPAPQVDYIVQVLAKRPWDEVDAMMEAIRSQLVEQQDKPQRPPPIPEHPRPIGNGHAEADTTGHE